MPEQLTYVVGPNGEMQEAVSRLPPPLTALHGGTIGSNRPVLHFFRDAQPIALPQTMSVEAWVYPTQDAMNAIHRGDPIRVEISGVVYHVRVDNWSYDSDGPDTQPQLHISGTVVASDP